jgi:hypothetical protein
MVGRARRPGARCTCARKVPWQKTKSVTRGDRESAADVHGRCRDKHGTVARHEGESDATGSVTARGRGSEVTDSASEATHGPRVSIAMPRRQRGDRFGQRHIPKGHGSRSRHEGESEARARRGVRSPLAIATQRRERGEGSGRRSRSRRKGASEARGPVTARDRDAKA